MLIQYCSDLHLEFQKNAYFLHSNPLARKADILILAGDIFLFSKNTDKVSFFDKISESYEKIYWLPGNHEFYLGDITKFNNYKEIKVRDNIEIVQNQVIAVNGVNLIFTTLWSNISLKNELVIKDSVNDFYRIKHSHRSFLPYHYNKLHNEAIQFLETELKTRQEVKNVIITHHVPTLLNYPEQYLNSSLNEAFAVEMFPFIDKYQPEAWIYGHNHINTPEFSIGKTKMLTNQLGYVEQREHLTFKPDAVLEV